jgi:hypothetical protein
MTRRLPAVRPSLATLQGALPQDPVRAGLLLLLAASVVIPGALALAAAGAGAAAPGALGLTAAPASIATAALAAAPAALPLPAADLCVAARAADAACLAADGALLGPSEERRAATRHFRL